MAAPVAAIINKILQSTGKGMKDGGEYLMGKNPSSNGNSKDDNNNNSVIKRITANKAAKNAMNGAGDMGEGAGAGATDAGAGAGAGAAGGAMGSAGAGASGAAAGGAGAAAGGAAAGASAGAGAAAAGASVASDERLKRVCGDNADLIDLFSKIGSYEFNYNDKAKSLYPNGEKHVDNKRHVGVMAQELEKNPATNAVVNTDKSGYKTVDTVQLTLTNTAVLADVCRRLEALERQLEQSM